MNKRTHQREDMHILSEAVEKGIKSEKTKESIGIFMVLGLIALSFFIGFMAHYTLGFLTLFAGLWGIWKYYKIEG